METIEHWVAGDTVTGNWFGFGKELARRGVRINLELISEFAGNPTGRIKQGATNVMASLLTGSIDFEKLTGNSFFKELQLVNSWIWGYGENHLKFPGFIMKTGFAWAGYLQANQRVYTEGAHSNQGLNPFGALVFSPNRDFSAAPFFAMGGAVYTGLIPGRDNDALSLGGSICRFSTDLPRPSSPGDLIPGGSELDLELNYKLALTKFFYLKPNLQNIIVPSGGAYPSAFVLGCEFGIIF